MFQWFKKIPQEYPKFWKDYLAHFNQANDQKPRRYVVFDTETTGLKPSKDVMLSIGAVVIEDHKILVAEYLDLYLIQDKYTSDTVAIHGILKNTQEKIVEAEAVIQFLKLIKDDILVGHHVNFDIEMINQALGRLGLGKLKNDRMDTGAMYQKWKGLQQEEHHTLDELCTLFNIPLNDRHTASGDAYITALLFLKLKKKLGI